jgi:hypothetical protein
MQIDEVPWKPKQSWGQFRVSDPVMKTRHYTVEADALEERDYAEGVELPALAQEDWSLEETRATTLRALYAEVCSGWRTLTDVRFKLLGLLPAISLAVVVTLLEQGQDGPKLLPVQQTVVGALGLLISSALWLYELRNTRLYDDLVGRGRRIEAELGIHTGHFRGRPTSTALVKHDVAITIIYLASMLAWCLAAFAPWVVGLHK